MVLSLLQASLICGFSWFFWKYFRQIVLKSPLDNVPGPVSQSLLFGNLPQLVDRLAWDWFQELTDCYSGIVKLHAPFGHRMLYVFDPVALHSVVVKDQHAYEEAAWFTRSNRLTFGPGLLATIGNQHKKQRKLLGPAFSMAHTKRMVPIFNGIGRKLQQAIGSAIGTGNKPAEIDMVAWTGRTTLELIGQAGLGYSFDPLVGARADEYGTAVKLFQPSLSKINVIRRFLPYLPDYAMNLQRKLMDMLGHKGLDELARVVDIMHRRSVEVYDEKKKALELGDEAITKQIGEGRDIMSILMRLNMNAAEEDKISEEEIIGQMATFIFAAMDTTSNALGATLALLAKHPDVQEKLRNEILGAFDADDDFDYDTLMSLPYLDAVCRESLRLHPPISVVSRETTQDIMMPVSEPMRGVDGTVMNEVLVPKDTTIIVAIHSANRNKAVWGEDALEWKPERWLSPLPSSVTEAKTPGIYTHLMSFNGGGHACIGFKFAQLGMKSILCRLISKFTFAPSDKEIVWILAGIRFPTVGGGPNAKPEMPMMVGHYHRPTQAV